MTSDFLNSGSVEVQSSGKNIRADEPPMSKDLESLQKELVETVISMGYEGLVSLRQTVRMSSIQEALRGVDVSRILPGDAISSIGTFLDASDLSAFQSCNRALRRAMHIRWREIGQRKFCGVLVGGHAFDETDCYTQWYGRYIEFSSAQSLFPWAGVLESVSSRTVRTAIPRNRFVSCTIPSMFSVSTAASTFVELTVSVKFSPEAVRSVIGLIESPAMGSPESLMCDRGLSQKHWGLAFGPLTGVVSSRGRYFDEFHTYRARHGLHDYLERAAEERVTVRVGILIERGRVAFFRLPETDYPDWECTGFVYETELKEVSPCLMFSHIGARDAISVTVNRVGGKAPFSPHANSRALDGNNWKSFREEDTNLVPPNSPIHVSAHAAHSAMLVDMVDF